MKKAYQAFDSKELGQYFKAAVAVKFLDVTIPEHTEKDFVQDLATKLDKIFLHESAQLTKMDKPELNNFLWTSVNVNPSAGSNLHVSLGNRLQELEATLKNNLGVISEVVF